MIKSLSIIKDIKVPSGELRGKSENAGRICERPGLELIRGELHDPSSSGGGRARDNEVLEAERCGGV